MKNRQDYIKRLEAAVYKKFLFSEAEKLSDLFSAATQDRGDPAKRPADVRIGATVLSPWCPVRSNDGEYRALWLTPKPETAQKIVESLVVPDDHMTFQLVERGDGWLVTVEHGKIIGSRGLALLPVQTLNQLVEE